MKLPLLSMSRNDLWLQLQVKWQKELMSLKRRVSSVWEHRVVHCRLQEAIALPGGRVWCCVDCIPGGHNGSPSVGVSSLAKARAGESWAEIPASYPNAGTLLKLEGYVESWLSGISRQCHWFSLCLFCTSASSLVKWRHLREGEKGRGKEKRGGGRREVGRWWIDQ